MTTRFDALVQALQHPDSPWHCDGILIAAHVGSRSSVQVAQGSLNLGGPSKSTVIDPITVDDGAQRLNIPLSVWRG